MITELDLLRTRLDARRDLLESLICRPLLPTNDTYANLHLQHVAHSYMKDAKRTIDGAHANGDLRSLSQRWTPPKKSSIGFGLPRRPC